MTTFAYRQEPMRYENYTKVYNMNNSRWTNLRNKYRTSTGRSTLWR